MKSTIARALTILALASLLFATVALYAAETLKIPVDSPAVVYSPGNWTGDAGRGGSVYRQTWNPGAYFRLAWESSSPKPTAKILLDTSTYPPKFRPPLIAYSIDGVWRSQIPCAKEIDVAEIPGAGRHELSVYLHQSQCTSRSRSSAGEAKARAAATCCG
jgi:hypothetical protein